MLIFKSKGGLEKVKYRGGGSEKKSTMGVGSFWGVFLYSSMYKTRVDR